VSGTRYLFDYGPNGFHFQFPGGGADPTPTLYGELSFDGADYLALPAARLAAFYAAMPTGAYTWLGNVTPIGGPPFSCYDGGNNGASILMLVPACRFYRGSGGAFPYIGSSATSFPSGRRRVLALTSEVTPRLLTDQSTDTATWVGAYATATYNLATVPRIGSYPSGASMYTGSLSYLALLRDAISTPDMLTLSQMLRDGGKPWCNRG